jgi:hypothetical protein
MVIDFGIFPATASSSCCSSWPAYQKAFASVSPSISRREPFIPDFSSVCLRLSLPESATWNKVSQKPSTSSFFPFCPASPPQLPRFDSQSLQIRKENTFMAKYEHAERLLPISCRFSSSDILLAAAISGILTDMHSYLVFLAQALIKQTIWQRIQ